MCDDHQYECHHELLHAHQTAHVMQVAAICMLNVSEQYKLIHTVLQTCLEERKVQKKDRAIVWSTLTIVSQIISYHSKHKFFLVFKTWFFTILKKSIMIEHVTMICVSSTISRKNRSHGVLIVISLKKRFNDLFQQNKIPLSNTFN